MRRLLTVDLPLAVPVIAAGLRVAAVSNVSIVSVASLIGVPAARLTFHRRLPADLPDPIVVGIVACVLLALLFDLGHPCWSRGLITPWQRAVASVTTC